MAIAKICGIMFKLMGHMSMDTKMCITIAFIAYNKNNIARLFLMNNFKFTTKNVMRKQLLLLLIGGILCSSLDASGTFDKTLKTRWSDEVSADNVWTSYPRPKLKRDLWQNLNGLWQYAITGIDADRKSVEYEGEILVPFAVESSLSGVKKTVLPTDRIWYSKEFVLFPEMKGKNIILHFGAVDYECDLWLNGRFVGSHTGGNNPFSFDITKFINKSGAQKLEMRVYDPTDTESVTRGKQQLDQKGIWYTPVSGIWKTVWLEALPEKYIKTVYPEADIYDGTVSFDILTNAKGDEVVEVDVFDNGSVIISGKGSVSDKIKLNIPDYKLWSPEIPKLYDVKIKLLRNGKVLDEVKTYFAFRKVSIVTDTAGYRRFALNDEILFQYGTLDQGWWPDGLLTPPSEKAMLWDMVQLKNMGFNTIRKHIKVEPELYYYYADSLGLMVWQDMVSGFATERKKDEHVAAHALVDWNASAEHSEQWQSELFEMIDQLRFYPSITTWVVFNEGWGQHNTKEIVGKVSEYDRSRIIDGVSGWTDRGVGDLYDIHNYPVTSMILSENNGGRVSVLGEFGGFGLPLQGHLWNPDMRNWGYKNIEGGVDLMSSYSRVVYDLETLISQGLSGAIYTQTTDVEGEVNGLITYDREIVKIPVDYMHLLHNRLYHIDAAEAVTLIPDARSKQSGLKNITVQGQNFVAKEFPIMLKGKNVVRSEFEFYSKKEFENLSLWLDMPGKVKVWINGTKVFEQESRQSRHYNQYNISDYSSYLKKGKNEFVLELESSVAKDYRFDYGLKAF